MKKRTVIIIIVIVLVAGCIGAGCFFINKNKTEFVDKNQETTEVTETETSTTKAEPQFEDLFYGKEYDYTYDKEELKKKTEDRIDSMCRTIKFDDRVDDDRVHDSLIKTFDTVIDNYDKMTTVFTYCHFLPCEDFVNGILDYLEARKEKIRIIYEDDKDFEEYNHEFSYLGANGYENGEEVVINGSLSGDYSCALLEELIHATQSNLDCDKYEGFGVYEIFLEGEPAIMYTLFNDGIGQYGDVIGAYGDDNYTLRVNSTKIGDEGLSGYYYASLLCLVGYDTLNYIKTYHDVDYVKYCIESRYGVDADEFMQALDRTYDIYETSSADLIAIQQFVCDCLASECSKISSKEDFISFLNMYRFYKLQYGVKDSYNYTDSDSLLHYDKVEAELLKKIQDFNLINGADSESVLIALLDEDNEASEIISIYDIDYLDFSSGDMVFVGTDDDLISTEYRNEE